MKRSLDRQNIVRDVSFFSGGTYISQVMFCIRGFLNAKILGPSLYGLWSALNIILSYASYVQLGSVNAMNREIPYQSGRSLSGDMRKTRNATFTICLFMNLVFSLTLIIIGCLLWNKVSLNESLGFIAIGILAVISSMHEYYKTLLIAIKSFFLISKANVIFSAFSIVLTLILVPMLNIYGVYIAAIIIPLSSLLYIWSRKPYKLRLNFDLKEISRLVGIGFPLMSIDFLESVITSIAGMMVLFFLGKANMGYYAVAMLAGRFLMYFPNSINRTFEPHIYQRYGETHRISELKKYIFKPAVVMSLIFPVVIVFYYTAVSFFIRHFLGKYNEAIYPFFIILIARFFASFSPTAPIFITAINKQRFLIPVYLTGIAIVAAAGSILINMGFGVSAVAVALLLTFFFVSSVIFVYTEGHYMKSKIKCLSHMFCLYIPLIYMIIALFVTETIILSAKDIIADVWRLVMKFGILFIFSAPLLYIADRKTAILSDLFSFFKKEKT